METWPKLHPDWEYTIYDNDFLAGYPFRLRRLIDEYFWRGLYAGVQDMMRYEILYEFGGFIADADAVCLHAVDELLDAPRAYTVYDRPETDKFRGVCPFLASEPRNPFIGAVIDRLATLEPWQLRKAEVSTGNRFLMSMIREYDPHDDRLKIWPTHYFVPWQKSDPDNYYSGPDKVYAEQKWATSMYAYNREGGPSAKVIDREELEKNRQDVLDRLVGAQGRHVSPLAGEDAAALERVSAVEAKAKDTLASDGCKSDFQALNETLAKALDLAKPQHMGFHGMHFYRHMQQSPLAGSGFRTRSQEIRDRLLGWLGQAKRALLVGFDTGHLPLAALHLSSELEMTAIESGQWMQDKDKKPPATQIYVPNAAQWLAENHPARFQPLLGNEPDVLQTLVNETGNHQYFDLVMLPSVNVRSLHILELCRPLLKPEGVVVCASVGGQDGLTHVDRLQMQRMAYAPIEQVEYGFHNGSLSAFRMTI
jgi:hypothetical protein